MLVERGQQLIVLTEALTRARSGKGATIVVSGEAGSGKSALLRMFAQHVPEYAALHWGFCDALSTPRPLGPIHDMANSLSEHTRAMLRAGEGQDKLFPVILQSIDESAKVPVFVIEDLHWGDAATFDLVRYIGRRIGFMKALLIVSVRGEELGPDHPLLRVWADLPVGEFQRVELQSLSREGVAALAKEAGKSAERIYEVTSGNPFFVSELLHADGKALPTSVRDAVWARLQRVPGDERGLLEILSVIPGYVEPWLLASVGGEEGERLATAACHRGLLLRDDKSNILFRHELARLATLERLPPEAQREAHEKILAALQRCGKVSWSRLMHHALGAGKMQAVVEIAPRAAAEAARLGAHLQAAHHLKEALKLGIELPVETKAQFLEDWSYEAGLSEGVTEESIAARSEAAKLWRQLGRADKVGHNLRWLSRLHWYRGESEKATEYLNQAVVALESVGPGPELAWAYSTRSQFHMLHDRMDEAVDWGRKAISVAVEFGAVEAQVHALNNIGAALLFMGNAEGKPYMEESLALALKHGFHEQAARAYTNYSEYAVLSRQFVLAERLLAEGIAFDTEHQLESWTHYLIGRLAQLRVEQGRLEEARSIAESVLARSGQTMLMKMPAQLMLARANQRLGRADNENLVATCLANANSIGEQQYISVAMMIAAEQAWLDGNDDLAREHLNKLLQLRIADFDPWERGEVAVWLRRLGMNWEQAAEGGALAAPFQSELKGEGREARRQWLDLGAPYNAALALLHTQPHSLEAAQEALQILEGIGAEGAARIVRTRLTAAGLRPRRSGSRGPYRKTRINPMGLTQREMEVLHLIAEGRTNEQISKKLTRSQRTVEHHVSAILSKLSARSRVDLVVLVRQEPWLLTQVS